jgi:hypothetical protein
MKKIILCATLLATSLLSKAQADSLTINQRLLFAASEMEKSEHFKKACFYVSLTGLVAAGVGFIPITTHYKDGIYGIERSRTEQTQFAIVSGVSVALFGYLLNQIGNTHIHKAASYLSGNGITIPLRKVSPIYQIK